jgi:predicted regulator of Ras-like GTPase activity (Roadblock/LC7/MglB family)
MDEILAQLTRVRGVGGAVLVSADGLTMASALRGGLDENALSAAIGEILGVGNRLLGALALGAYQGFTASTDQGSLIILAAGPAFVVLLADAGANLALVTIESKPLVERLGARLAL